MASAYERELRRAGAELEMRMEQLERIVEQAHRVRAAECEHASAARSLRRVKESLAAEDVLVQFAVMEEVARQLPVPDLRRLICDYAAPPPVAGAAPPAPGRASFDPVVVSNKGDAATGLERHAATRLEQTRPGYQALVRWPLMPGDFVI